MMKLFNVRKLLKKRDLFAESCCVLRVALSDKQKVSILFCSVLHKKEGYALYARIYNNNVVLYDDQMHFILFLSAASSQLYLTLSLSPARV
jgi:hypothetical protein